MSGTPGAPRPRLLYTFADTMPVRPSRPPERQIEPDAGCPADQVVLGHESPETPVQAVVAVIADHEVLARRHHQVLDRIVAIGLRTAHGLVALVALLDVPIAARNRR